MEKAQLYLGSWQSDYYQLQVGGPYQATGGMGDTLAGMIARLQASLNKPVSTSVWQPTTIFIQQ